VGPSSPSSLTPHTSVNPTRGQASGDARERNTTRRRFPRVLAVVGGLTPVTWESDVAPSLLGPASVPHGCGARRGQHISTAAELAGGPGHPPAAYPLDECASRDRRQPHSSAPWIRHLRLHNLHPSPPPSHLPHLVARRGADIGGRHEAAAPLPPEVKEAGRRVRPPTGATAAAAPTQVVVSTFPAASSSGRASTGRRALDLVEPQLLVPKQREQPDTR
jgi:hypothetical protein